MLTTVLIVMLTGVPQEDLACDAAARAIFAALLRDARYGFAAEEAAFIIRMDNGTVGFVRWRARETDSASWRGAVPRGTIAIVHTHPNWLSMPSRIDARSATAVHLPVYVVTASRITKTDGGENEVVVDGRWADGV
jgi:proteasome lid subunit RPN8/RPN11